MELLGFTAIILVVLLMAGWLDGNNNPSPSTREIARLNIRDGDFLVIRLKENIPFAEKERIKHEVEKTFSNKVKCLIISGDVDLSVLTPFREKVE